MKLKLEHISASLSGTEVLHDLSLEVADGTFVCLLGASGCGKSTLLKTIAGILPQSQGHVIIGDQIADALPPHRRGTVIVFQDMRLFPHMSAVENVAFPLRMQGVARAHALQTAATFLERVQLGGMEKRRPHQLSGGQQQRVALARALAAKPRALLLDEPFSGLDETLRAQMRCLVRELHDEFGATTILVTHDKEEALGLADQIVLMEEGRILQTGTPQALYERPASVRVAAFFGEAAFLPGTVLGGRFSSALFQLPCGAANGHYTAVVRPHALSVAPGHDFALVRSQYTGEAVLAVLRHMPTGQELRAQLPAESRLDVGAVISLTLDPAKLILIPHQP